MCGYILFYFSTAVQMSRILAKDSTLPKVTKSGYAQEAIIFEQDGRSAGVALFHFGGSDEIVASQNREYDAFSRRQAVFEPMLG